MSKRKELILKAIYAHTLECLEDKQYDKLGMDASSLAMDLRLDRSNVSRDLNLLHQEGRLIKLNGRPTLYVSRQLLMKYFPEQNIPAVLSKDQQLTNFLTKQQRQNEQTQMKESLDTLIGKNIGESMYEPIQKAKAAMNYPYSGLNTIIEGQEGTNRKSFAQLMFLYGKQNGRFSSFHSPIIADCSLLKNYSVHDLDLYVFGEIIDSRLRRGLVEKARQGMLILLHFEQLPDLIKIKICNAITEAQYHPHNAVNRRFTFQCQVIITTSSPELKEESMIRRCFPTLISLPSLQQRTLEETVMLVLKQFQEEAYFIKRAIRISKGILSCFAMSSYKGNLPHLKAEIRSACANAYTRLIKENPLCITLDFADISNTVLSDIYDVNERYQQLNTILALFTHNDFYFSTMKENEELQMLYHINEELNQKKNISINNAKGEIVNQCLNDMNAFMNVHLNTIRSVLLKDIYDLLYPVLQGKPISRNENILYGMLSKLSEFISAFKEDTVPAITDVGAISIARKKDYLLFDEIQEAVSSRFNYTFTKWERDYIATYVYLSSQWLQETQVQLLIVTENGRSKEYARYLHSHDYGNQILSLELDTQVSHDALLSILTKHVQESDKGKGVLIITDSKDIKLLEKELQTLSNCHVRIVPDLDLPLLLTLLKRASSIGATFETILQKDAENPIAETEAKDSDSYAMQLIQQMDETILSDSLVFLNPRKSSQILYKTLNAIIKQLQLPYSDNLLIKFIFHCSFTLERCIKNEPLSFPKMKAFINRNNYVYNIIERNFHEVQEVFDCTIPPSEFSFITEIFLPLTKE